MNKCEIFDALNDLFTNEDDDFLDPDFIDVGDNLNDDNLLRGIFTLLRDVEDNDDA